MKSRLFEHTEDEIVDEFSSAGIADLKKLCTIPAILMQEGIGDETAGVGWIERISDFGSVYKFRFSLDPHAPKFTNKEIQEFAEDLEIGEWEFHRNHWAVKDVDLFRTLYQMRAKRSVAPKIFSLSEEPIERGLVSMMMPFSGSFSDVYSTVKEKLESESYTCQRADDFWEHPHIMHDIVELLCQSQVVVCDLSGKNPNVFYEAGLAHAFGKEVILITQSMDDVPFDLKQLRCITYHNNNEGRERLAHEILQRLQKVAPLDE